MKTNEEIVKEYREINGWQNKILNGEGYELTDEELVKAFWSKGLLWARRYQKIYFTNV